MTTSRTIPPGYAARSRRLLHVTGIFIVLSISACQNHLVRQGYEGPGKPDNEIARVIVPQELEITYINGLQYGKAMFVKETRIDVLPGNNDIVLEYLIFWDISSDDHEKIVSQPFLLHFNAVAGASYRVSFKQPESLEDARLFAKKPDIQLLDDTGNPVPSAELRYQLSDARLMASFTESATDNSALSAPTPGLLPAGGVSALDMLKYWWPHADSQQQEEFRRWINH